ncbi:MAG: hypothetical protein ACQEXJ_13800 [Myxococcota bacterium]
MIDEHRGEGADVLHLECARFRAALADEDLDARAREHRRACPDCDRFAREMQEAADLVARATGPAEVPDDFAAGVLGRADHLAGRLGDGDRRRRAIFGGARGWIAAAVAVTVTMAFWAGDMSARSRHDSHSAEPVATAPASEEAPPAAEAPTAGSADEGAPEAVRLTPQPSPRNSPKERPVVPAAQPIPEPSVDVPDELRRSMLRAVERGDDCPEHAGGAVRVTVTIRPDGTLADRQILSLGEAGEAHRCVSRAMDHLMLPPMEESVTVTLDLTW